MMSNTDTLFSLAKKYLPRAYAPYSKFHVAAALELESGEIFGGCNIENASYGGTVCAERVATWKAISEHPGAKIKRILVLTDSAKAWPPCGFCRQVISEFSTPATEVIVANLHGVQSSRKIGELLPDAFGPADLKA